MIFVDIGGTKTAIKFEDSKLLGLFLENYRPVVKRRNMVILKTEKIKNKKNFLHFVKFLKELDKVVMDIPGVVSYGKTFRIKSPYFPFIKKLNVEFVANDVYAFSFEVASRFFSKENNKNKSLLSVEIGTGVNGLFLNYFDYENLTFLSKHIEMGHMTFEKNGYKCECGKKGCVEQYISGKFLNRFGGYKKVFSNKKLKSLFYENLSIFFSSMISSLQPDKIVIGGGVSKSINLLLLKNYVRKNMPYNMKFRTSFEKVKGVKINLLGLEKLYKRYVVLRNEESSRSFS